MPWLIPVRLDDCEIPDLPLGGGRTFAHLQRADLFGEQREQETARLVAAATRILQLMTGAGQFPAVMSALPEPAAPAAGAPHVQGHSAASAASMAPPDPEPEAVLDVVAPEAEPAAVTQRAGQAAGGRAGLSTAYPPAAGAPGDAPAQPAPPGAPPGRAPGFRLARRVSLIAGAVLVAATAVVVIIAITDGGTPRARAGLPPLYAYTANDDGTVTPINLATGQPGTPIRVGKNPDGIAITPNGATAYVTNHGDGTVTPIILATGHAGGPIQVGVYPEAIAITPDGAIAYVTNAGNGTVTPIILATGHAGSQIQVGAEAGPNSIAITRSSSASR